MANALRLCGGPKGTGGDTEYAAAAPQERHSSNDESTSAPRRGDHPCDGEYAGPARRERQGNEPDVVDAGATHLGMLNDNALRLLQIMGRRGSWTSDLLFERSALPFPELQHAILLLELEGRVRRRGCEIDPV
jgi:hypothetical protein